MKTRNLLFTILLVAFLECAGAQNITIGVTQQYTVLDSNDANYLQAQEATLPQSATIQSLSFYVANPVGQIVLGLYDSNGANGSPGKLLAQTAAMTPVSGWNTGNVTPVTLAAGNYWLAYNASDNAMMPVINTSAPPSYYIPLAFGSMPSQYPVGALTQPAAWSFYGTLSVTPTPTPTPSPTPTPGQITLAWDPPSAIAGYKLFYGTVQGGPYPNMVDVGLVYTKTITGLPSGTTLYWITRSYDAAGNLSCPSPELAAKVP